MAHKIRFGWDSDSKANIVALQEPTTPVQRTDSIEVAALLDNARFGVTTRPGLVLFGLLVRPGSCRRPTGHVYTLAMEPSGRGGGRRFPLGYPPPPMMDSPPQDRAQKDKKRGVFKRLMDKCGLAAAAWVGHSSQSSRRLQQ